MKPLLLACLLGLLVGGGTLQVHRYLAADRAPGLPARTPAHVRPHAYPEFTQPVRPQAAPERTMQPVDAQAVGKRPSLGRPLFVQSDEEALYVLDGADMQVHAFSWQGDQRRTYGEGQGVGPGQHMLIVGFGRTSDGRMVIGDARGRRISVMDAAGTLLRTLRPEQTIMRLAVTSEDVIAYLAAPTAMYFQPVDGNEASEGEPLVRDPMQWIGALDGGLRPDTQGGLIQFAFYYDVLIRWTARGRIDYIRQMIGEYPPTPLTDATLGKRVRTAHVQYRVNDVAVHGEAIHVLVLFLNRPDPEHVVDVYDLQGGAYRYSYTLPEPIRGIAVEEGFTAGLQDTTFAVWGVDR